MPIGYMPVVVAYSQQMELFRLTLHVTVAHTLWTRVKAGQAVLWVELYS